MVVNKAKQFKHTHHLDVNKAFTPLMRKVYNDQKRKGGGKCGSKLCPTNVERISPSQSQSKPKSKSSSKSSSKSPSQSHSQKEIMKFLQNQPRNSLSSGDENFLLNQRPSFGSFSEKKSSSR